jgi:hypothetical protein
MADSDDVPDTPLPTHGEASTRQLTPTTAIVVLADLFGSSPWRLAWPFERILLRVTRCALTGRSKPGNAIRSRANLASPQLEVRRFGCGR